MVFKNVAATLLMVCFAATAAAVPTFKDGDDSVRLYEDKCTNTMVLAAIQTIEPNSQEIFRRASALVGGKAFEACWHPVDEIGVHLIYEDGDQGQLPIFAFKDDPGA